MKTNYTFLPALRVLAVALALSAAASAELPPKVKEVLERNVEAMGGREKISSIESTRLVGTFSVPALGMKGESVMVHVYPDKVYSKQELPGMGEMIQAYDGETGWAQDPMQGFRVLSEPEVAALKQNESLRELVDFESTYSSGEFVGETEIDGQQMQILKLMNTDTGEAETHYYSKSDGLLRKLETIADMGAMGKLPATLVLLSYAEQDGVLFPEKMEVMNAGMTIDLEFTSLELDPEIEPSLFQPPQ